MPIGQLPFFSRPKSSLHMNVSQGHEIQAAHDRRDCRHDLRQRHSDQSVFRYRTKNGLAEFFVDAGTSLDVDPCVNSRKLWTARTLGKIFDCPRVLTGARICTAAELIDKYDDSSSDWGSPGVKLDSRRRAR